MIVSALSIGLAALIYIVPPGEEKIEARVNEAILTTSELNRTLEPLYRQYEATLRGAELDFRKKQTREAAVRGWIENQLILQEVQSLEGFRVDQMEVERMLEEEKKRFAAPDEFEQALDQEGITEKEYKKILEDRYKVRFLTFQRVTGLINIAPRSIIDYYRQNQAEYREEEMARISLILIPAGETPEGRQAARELAETVLGELEAGADFAELARRHSSGPRAEEGGDFGFVERGQWKAQLEDAAFRLEVGEHSGIIETDEGFYLLYCAGKKEASLTPLEEVWESIEEELYRREYERRYEAWIEDLKSRAHVVVGE
jgi:peptidyl-prolyl cis-trans isomerase SurA